jgi:hypothetical protein
MKFLIDNYASNQSTQPLYLYKNINQYAEHEAFIRMNGEVSIYDSFDRISPDIYITSVHILSQDAIIYLKENKVKTRICLCLNGANKDMIEKAEDSFLSNEVPCAFFFTNDYDVKLKKTRLLYLQEAADLNTTVSFNLKYNIDKAIFTSGDKKIKNYDGTYHILSVDQKPKNNVDFSLPIHIINNLFHNYKEIISTDIYSYIPQYFFDAIARGVKTYYDIENEILAKEIDELCGKILKIDNRLNYNNPNKLDNFEDLRKHVLEKHTCESRTKSFLSQLPQSK